MLAEKQRIRAVNERKTHLILELERIGYDIDLDKPLSSFNLSELEQIHINEKCRIANNPKLREFYDRKNYS